MSSASKNLLVAVDGSVASLRAARLAVDLAARRNASVRVIAVAGEKGVERLLDTDRSHLTPALERRRAQLRDALEYVRRLGTDAGMEVEPMLVDGAGAEAYEIILREAEAWPADLLFVGRRAHRGLGRALLGSQAEHVLEFAQIPVVVVPEPAFAAARSQRTAP